MQPLTPDSASATPNDRFDLSIAGMTCAACVRRVEKSLQSVAGVVGATVNLATQKATVQTEPGLVTADALSDAVVRAGYKVLPEPRPTTIRKAAQPHDPDANTGDAEPREIRNELIASASLTLPLLVLAMSHGRIDGTETLAGRLAQLFLATPVVFGPGRRFLRLALAAARHHASDMNTLVSIGVLAAWGYSAVAVLAPGLFPHADHGVLPHLYFEAAASIITFVLLGKWLEAGARKRLGEAVRGLIALVPSTAHRLHSNDAVEDVALEQLAAGDLLLVRPGERIPSDAVVVRGASAVDESMFTGEALPVDKSAGDSVFGGSLNQSGSLVVRITQLGRDTAVSRIVDAVEQAQSGKAPIARLADVVSGYFVPVVIAIASVTLITWIVLDPTSAGLAVAVERFVAVLVIACPCALGLATPAAVAVGTGRGAELGVLIKGGPALETASRVDSIFLDKTGTLTSGKPTLTEVIPHAGFEGQRLLSLVASLERESEHPVARAIVQGANDRGAGLFAASEFVSAPGGGVEGRVDGQHVRVGTRAWLAAAGIDSDLLEADADQLARRGRTPSFVAVDGQLVGLIAISDPPAPAAKHVVQAVRDLGVEVTMLTGDRKQTADAIAGELDIAKVVAELRPEDKARWVIQAREQGRIVAMVGDGINDAPALAAAHVGIAIGTGTDIAVAAADVALMRGGISALPIALRLARATMTTIRQNLFWAFVYNAIGIPIAAGALHAWTGWSLSPVLASAAMSLSSVSVLANSLRLKWFRPQSD